MKTSVTKHTKHYCPMQWCYNATCCTYLKHNTQVYFNTGQTSSLVLMMNSGVQAEPFLALSTNYCWFWGLKVGPKLLKDPALAVARF